MSFGQARDKQMLNESLCSKSGWLGDVERNGLHDTGTVLTLPPATLKLSGEGKPPLVGPDVPSDH